MHLQTYTYTHTHVHAHIHDKCAFARAYTFEAKRMTQTSVSSLPPHDTDDQDRARAIRTRRWRRQLFCGTNRARAPRPWRTYSTPSWDCHPRRVPRVLARGDPSWPPRPPSAIVIRTPPSARRKPGRAAATYAKTSKVGGLCKFSFWSADLIQGRSISIRTNHPYRTLNSVGIEFPARILRQRQKYDTEEIPILVPLNVVSWIYSKDGGISFWGIRVRRGDSFHLLFSSFTP